MRHGLWVISFFSCLLLSYSVSDTWPETRFRKITPDNAHPGLLAHRICTGNGAAFTNRALSGRRLEDKRNRTFSHDEKSPSDSLTPYFNGSPVFNN
jgi:hypothetical protein